MAESPRGGENSRRRPVRALDPVAGMRALAEVQAEGLRAAGELIERMLRSETDGRRDRSGSPAVDYGPLVEAWADLLRRTVEGLSSAAESGVRVDVDSNGVGPQVRLTMPAAGEGEGGEAEVWLHNGTPRGVGPLALRCAPLNDADGNVLENAEVRIDPPEISSLSGRSSRAVAVSLAANGPLRPGTYRGTIQATGAPGLWLPLEVVIEPC